MNPTSIELNRLSRFLSKAGYTCLQCFLILSLVIPQIPIKVASAQAETEVGDWPSYQHDAAMTSFANYETDLTPPLEQTGDISLSSSLITNNPPVLAGGY
jgi:hypothetical protein